MTRSITSLSSSEVHVWTISISSLGDDPHSRLNLLSADELERRASFRFDEDKRRFSLTREVLRILVGAHTHTDPPDVAFSISPAGKPRLANPSCNLRFNVTHSGDFAMIALARDREVGVDLEMQRPDLAGEELVARCFSENGHHRWLQMAVARRTEAFFRLWTAKEAFIKATGAGLSMPLNSFDVELLEGCELRLAATRQNPKDALRWNIQNLAAPAGYCAALATEGESGLIHQFVWEGPLSQVLH
jgi:4'-phosphopantetheinyl transferase